MLVGVADGADGRAKFSACPHPMVTTAWLQTSVHNFTRPPVEIVPFDASSLLGEMMGCGGNNLYALRVPRTRCISGHVTNKGVSKLRVGKECQPQYVAEDDRTNAPVCAQGRRATRLRYAPTVTALLILKHVSTTLRILSFVLRPNRARIGYSASA